LESKPERERPPERIDAGIGREKESSGFGSLWLAVGLDILGVAAFGVGVWLNGEAENFHRNYMDLKGGSEADYASAQKEVENAAANRNIAYAMGVALLAAGIGVHIWF
jgi:hypothetical protein